MVLSINLILIIHWQFNSASAYRHSPWRPFEVSLKLFIYIKLRQRFRIRYFQLGVRGRLDECQLAFVLYCLR